MNLNRTMKELPVSEQPYEKCLHYGPSSLTDAELLAVLLRTGMPGEPVTALAVRLLCDLSERGGLRALMNSTPEELCRCRGIGNIKAMILICAAELARRISRQEAAHAVTLKDPSSIAAYFMEDMRSEEQEMVVAVFFDSRGHLLQRRILSRGTVNASLITPREVFLEALKYRAVYVVLLHNHPSGDPTPSEEDLLLTERMSEAGRILSIPLMDHIVIGDHCYISFKEQDLVL